MNNWERDLRDAERNQELRRQNNLLEQQRWEQQESNQKQHAALQEQNRLSWKQNEALQERNELERQRQWDEKLRHEKELELRKEQQYKDNIFDLKKLWAKAESEDERVRIQILLAEAETEYNQYLLEKEREKEQEELARHHREKISRIKWFFGIAISLLLLAIIGTFFIGMTKSKSSYTHNSNNHSTQPSTSETSTSSTTKSSSSTSKSKDKQTSTTSPTTRPQATKVYIGNYIGRKSTDVIAELKEKKVPENLIKVVEEESSETEAGLVMKQSLSEGTTYDLSKATEITLTVAKKATSMTMPNYVGYSLEFAKNNLKSLGISEDKIEVKEVDTVQERISEGEVAKQIPAPYEKLDINHPIVKLYIYKPKTHQTSQSRSR